MRGKDLVPANPDSWSNPDNGRRMNTFVIVKNGASYNAVVTVVTKDSSMPSPRSTRELHSSATA